MKEEWFIFAIVAGLLLAIAGFLLSPKVNYQEVMRACMVARGEINGASEERCGELQDKTNTVFNCNNNGKCWLEIKEY